MYKRIIPTELKIGDIFYRKGEIPTQVISINSDDQFTTVWYDLYEQPESALYFNNDTIEIDRYNMNLPKVFEISWQDGSYKVSIPEYLTDGQRQKVVELEPILDMLESCLDQKSILDDDLDSQIKYFLFLNRDYFK